MQFYAPRGNKNYTDLIFPSKWLLVGFSTDFFIRSFSFLASVLLFCINIMQFHTFMTVDKNVEFLSTFVSLTRYYNHRFISDISRILAFSTFLHFYNSHKCISMRDLSVSLIYRRRGISFRLFLRENRLMESVINETFPVDVSILTSLHLR